MGDLFAALNGILVKIIRSRTVVHGGQLTRALKSSEKMPKIGPTTHALTKHRDRLTNLITNTCILRQFSIYVNL